MKRLLLILSLLMGCVSARAATITFAVTNYDGTAATNVLKVFPISTPILADGSWVIQGLPTRLQLVNGTNSLYLLKGNYAVTNEVLKTNILFAAPSGTGTYSFVAPGIHLSGGNMFDYTPGVSAIAPGANITTTTNGLAVTVSFNPTNASLVQYANGVLTNDFFTFSGGSVVSGFSSQTIGQWNSGAGLSLFGYDGAPGFSGPALTLFALANGTNHVMEVAHGNTNLMTVGPSSVSLLAPITSDLTVSNANAIFKDNAGTTYFFVGGAGGWPAWVARNGSASFNGISLNGGNFTGNGSGINNIAASNVVNTFTYTNTNITFASFSNGLGSMVLNVTGATGTHTNSNNVGFDFSAANGTYIWDSTLPGLNWNPPAGQQRGGFSNTLANGWQLGYVYSGVAAGLGGSFGGWTFYRTNGALPFVDGTTHNAVLWGYNGSIWLPDMQTPDWWSYQPDGATSNVRVIPSYVTNTYAVTVDTRSALPSLLKPPSIGGTKSWLLRGNSPIPGQAAGYRGLLSLTNGSGIVREIKLNVSGLGGWNGFHTNIWLQLFPDCGMLSNTVTPSFSAPLSVLASDYYSLSVPSWSYDTRYVSVAQHSGSGAISPSGNIAALVMVLKTPCRFTNGFYAALTNKTAGAELTGADAIFTTVNYSMDEVGFLASDPYKDWRLRSAFTRGAFGPPSGYATNDWTKTTPTILNTQKPGVLLGLWVSAGLTGNGLAFENSFHIYTDGNLTPWQGDGEDTPLNPWEFENGGNIMGLDFGTPNYLYGQYVEWYRQYDTGNVYWNHDALGVFPAIQGNSVTDNKDILLIYYGP